MSCMYQNANVNGDTGVQNATNKSPEAGKSSMRGGSHHSGSVAPQTGHVVVQSRLGAP